MGEQGSLAVEAALVLPLILVVLISAIEVTSVATTQLGLIAAAREGARVAAVTPEPEEAVRAVRRVLSGSSPVRVEVERPTAVGEPATVVVSVDKPLATPLLESITVPLRARAVMRVEA